MKIADFGMAKDFRSSSGKFTSDVATFFYRAPELMITATDHKGRLTNSGDYSAKIDSWSVGVVYLELITGVMPFTDPSGGIHTELDIVCCIVNALGEPPEDVYPLYQKVKFRRSVKYHFPFNYFVDFNLQCEVAQGLLRWDPSARLSAREALEMLS